MYDDARFGVEKLLIVIVMGVSGSGKTTIGSLLAARLGCTFVDADDFHSPDNKAKMHAGIPLTDEDRLPWLGSLTEMLRGHETRGASVVLACSALKADYRKMFIEASPGLVFVYLKSDFETIAARLRERKHAFMNPELLRSQFDTLEEPDDAVVVDETRMSSPERAVDAIVRELGERRV